MTPHTNRLTRISDSSSSSTSSTSVPTLPTPTTTSSSSSYVPDFKPDFRLLTLPRTDHTTNYILNDPAHHQFTYHTPPPLSNYVHLITNNNNNNSNLRSTPPGLASPSVQFFDQLHYNGMNSHLMNIPSSSSSSSTTTTTTNFNPCSNPSSFNKYPSLGAQSELDLNCCRYSQGNISNNHSQNQNQNQMMMMMMMNGGRPSGFTKEQWVEFTQQTYIFKHLCNYGYNPNPTPTLHTYNPFLCFNGDYQPHPGLGLDMDERKLMMMMMMMMRSGSSNGGSLDPEPGRCRRTDGKKWRCSRDVVPDQKYCERHLHRGRHRAARSKLTPSAANPTANPTANPSLITLNPPLITANHAANPSLTTHPSSKCGMDLKKPSQMNSRSHGAALDATNPSLVMTNPLLFKHYPSSMDRSVSQYHSGYGAQKDVCSYAMNPPLNQLLHFSLGTSAATASCSSTTTDNLPMDRSGSSTTNVVLSEDPSELRTLVLEQTMANNLEVQSQESLLLKKTNTNSWLRDDYEEEEEEEEEEQQQQQQQQHRNKRKFQATMESTATTNTDLSISLKAPRSLGAMDKCRREEEEMGGIQTALSVTATATATATDYEEDDCAILNPYIGLNLGTVSKFRREGSMWWESSPLAEALQINSSSSTTPNPSPCLEEQDVWEYHHHHHHHHHQQHGHSHSHSHGHGHGHGHSHSASATNFSSHCDFLITNASSSVTTKDSGSSPSLASPTGVLQIKSYSDSSSNSAISSPRSSSGPKLDSTNTTPPAPAPAPMGIATTTTTTSYDLYN